MTDEEFESELYQAEDVRDGREVTPLTDYMEEGEDGRAYVEFTCPSCDYSITPDNIVLEGGGTCPGCEREVKLHITSHDNYHEWRNIPEDRQEAYR